MGMDETIGGAGLSTSYLLLEGELAQALHSLPRRFLVLKVGLIGSQWVLEDLARILPVWLR
jgi:hypothetical protein